MNDVKNAKSEEKHSDLETRYTELMEINKFLLQKLSGDQEADDQKIISAAVSNKLHTLELQDEVEKLTKQIEDQTSDVKKNATVQLIRSLKLRCDTENQLVKDNVQVQLNTELFKHKYAPIGVQQHNEPFTEEQINNACAILQNISILHSILPSDEPLDLTNLARDQILQIAILKYISENIN